MNELLSLINSFDDSSSCSHIKSISSICHQETLGFLLPLLLIFSSRAAMKRIAYGGTNFMPIDVSCIYLQVLSENSEMFFCNTSSVKKTNKIMEEHEIQ